ncbi:MAG: hypothetical protein ACRDS9_28925, partial [Pseudonocardiaceae bacterium]
YMSTRSHDASRKRSSGRGGAPSRHESTGTPVRRSGDPERTVLRLGPDLRQRLEYWSDRHGISMNEYATEAVEAAIRRENGDYDLPTLEIARLNQLVDEMRALSTNSANLERVVTQGFESLIGLTRGDNYLLDPEDGEL